MFRVLLKVLFSVSCRVSRTLRDDLSAGSGGVEGALGCPGALCGAVGLLEDRRTSLRNALDTRSTPNSAPDPLKHRPQRTLKARERVPRHFESIGGGRSASDSV